MCGRYVISRPIAALAAEFSAQYDFDPATVEDYSLDDYDKAAAAGNRPLLPSWNIPPRVVGPQVPVILESAKGTDTVHRWLEMAQWSLNPAYNKEPLPKFNTFNAVSEEVTHKATFKGSVASKRAIFPADGYWEWKKNPDGTKTRYFIHAPAGAGLALGGLYSWWQNEALPENHPAFWTLTATILTMPAVGELAEIHHRTPLPLPKNFWDEWLSQDTLGDQEFIDHAANLAVPEALALEFFPVVAMSGDSARLLTPA